MEIIIRDVTNGYTTNLFGGGRIAYESATVEFPEHGVTIGVSHREDDPVGVWCADWRIESNGFPVFSHGTADRSCDKQTINQTLVDAILSGVTDQAITI